MPDDSMTQIVKVALGVCLVCSLLVSAAAVTLSNKQIENQKLDKIKNILIAGDLYAQDVDVWSVYQERVEPRLINVTTGDIVDENQFNDELNIEAFDIEEFAGDPKLGEAIEADLDIADIKRKPKYMVIYIVKQGAETDKIILPIYGKGLWSTLYGFLALENDLQTISGITFYEHGETPGLGGEVDNPRWKNGWKGKQGLDDAGNVTIRVIKGLVDPDSPNAGHQIDGLSGSTITTRGVDNLVRYWLGENGYGAYLSKMREAA
jgi:Na+-transporting NADH:ubiquinone oxidoreductase subunit C